MSSPREQLEAVVAKWRSEIRDYPYTEQGIAAQCAVKLCADELVALLASWQEPAQELTAKRLAFWLCERLSVAQNTEPPLEACADCLADANALLSAPTPAEEQGTCEWCDGHAIMCAECITKMKSEQYKAILATAEAMNEAPGDILNQVVSERFGTLAEKENK